MANLDTDVRQSHCSQTGQMDRLLGKALKQTKGRLTGYGRTFRQTGVKH